MVPRGCLSTAGWQAGLLSKLTLGSVVVTHPTLYPMWYEGLLLSGVHLLRTSAPDLTDLRAAVRLATSPETALAAEAIAAAGRRRACELLHLPHLMHYVAALLRRYAARFEGAHSARLHHAVRRLRETHNGSAGARVLQPEALWAELGVPARCSDQWWHDPRCASSREAAVDQRDGRAGGVS